MSAVDLTFDKQKSEIISSCFLKLSRMPLTACRYGAQKLVYADGDGCLNPPGSARLALSVTGPARSGYRNQRTVGKNDVYRFSDSCVDVHFAIILLGITLHCLEMC